jgi:hypothetical protein
VIQLTPCSGVVNSSTFTNEIDIDVEFLNRFLEAKVYHVGGPNWGTIDEPGTTASNICLGYQLMHAADPELPEPEGVCNLLNEFGNSQAITIMMQIHYT